MLSQQWVADQRACAGQGVSATMATPRDNLTSGPHKGKTAVRVDPLRCAARTASADACPPGPRSLSAGWSAITSA